jgi:hypothetical protein
MAAVPPSFVDDRTFISPSQRIMSPVGCFAEAHSSDAPDMSTRDKSQDGTAEAVLVERRIRKMLG